METNPYTTPTSDVFAGSSAVSTEGITDGVLQQLKGTKGWVKLMAVMLFLGAGLMFLLGLVMASSGAFSSAILSASAGGADLSGLGGAFGIVIGLIYAAIGLVYLYPGMKLWKYGNRITQLLQDRAATTLEAALNEQRCFWKYIGIMTLIMLSIYALIFIGAIIVGIFAAASAAG